MNFFFVTAFQQELGTVGMSMLGSIQTLAYAIVATMLLLNIYETFARGGGPRGLIIALVKYAACALIIQNWQTFFSGVSSGFSGVAGVISSNDFVTTFSSTLFGSGGSASSWTFSFSGIALIPLLSSILWVAIALIYYIWMAFFAIMYTAWGLVLFAIGPILIALLPSNATSSFAKHYLKSLAEWAAWPVLYAIIGTLAGNMTVFTGGQAANSFATSVVLAPAWNLLQNIVIAVIYILFLIALPFIASHLINGNFAGTVGATVRALGTVATAGSLGVAVGAGAAAAGKAASSGASMGESLAAGKAAANASGRASSPSKPSAPPVTPGTRLARSMSTNKDSQKRSS
jgi:hypothetical protein